MADSTASPAETTLPARPAADRSTASPDPSPMDGAPLPIDESERLALLRECRILDTPADRDFDDLTRLAAQICGSSIAVISMIDETRQWFKSRRGVEATETPRRLAFCAHAILDPSHLLIVPDATKDPRFATNELVTGPMGIRFYAGAPLVMEGGHALGSLCVIDQHPRELTEDQQESLTALARQVVSQIQLRRKNFALREARIEREEFFTRPLDMLCIAGSDGYFKLLNPAFSETLGFTTEELLARPLFDFVHPEDVAATHAEMAHVVSGSPAVNFEHRFRCRDGSYRWLSWKCAPALDGVLYASARDITEAKQMEATLQRQRTELRVLFDYLPALIVFKDTKNGLLRVNQRLADSMGKTVEEIEGKATEEIYPQDAAKYYADDLEVIHSGVPKLGIIESFRDGENRDVWVQTDKVPVCDKAGEVIGLIAMAQDITARHAAERRLQASLVEKETLLQEIHHRVKNNLQVVSSLLSLQSGYIHDPVMLAQFQECQGRIRSMALIHEKLYQSETLARVDLKDYLASLARIVLTTYAATGTIRLEVELAPVSTNIDTAVPLGLLVNELLTNAVKYAFPDHRPGRVRLVLRREAERDFMLIVEDDGIGLPAGFDPAYVKTLGMRLVGMFVKQLRAKLTTHFGPGQTSFTIRCTGALDDAP